MISIFDSVLLQAALDKGGFQLLSYDTSIYIYIYMYILGHMYVLSVAMYAVYTHGVIPPAAKRRYIPLHILRFGTHTN